MTEYDPTPSPYLTFESPVGQPFAPEAISGYLANVGAATSAVSTEEAAALRACYEAALRDYHGPGHGGFVGQPDAPQELIERLSGFTSEEATSILATAGLFHDTVYMHVDARDDAGTGAWPEMAEQYISGVARKTRTIEDGKVLFRTYLTEAGGSDEVTGMVAQIFGMQDGIIHNQGGNEFASALLAAKFLEAKGAPAKIIMAVTAAIAATVPFKPAKVMVDGKITDGHMGELANRLKATQLQLGGERYQPDWQDTNDIMQLSVHLANRDIAPFVIYDNFGAVIDNGRRVKKEELPELRQQISTIRELLRVASLERSAPLLYQWLASGAGPVSAANVPHFYILRDQNGNLQQQNPDAYYPPLPVYEEAVVHAETNSRLSTTFFQAHEAAIALVASIAALNGDSNAEVPGIVHAESWRDHAEPRGGQYNQLATEEVMLFWMMMGGVGSGAVDAVTPRRAPIGAMLFGVLGTQGIANLSTRIQEIYQNARRDHITDPFSNPTIAYEYVTAVRSLIGLGNFFTVLKELQHVAETFAHNQDRAQKLGDMALRGPQRPAAE